MFSKITFTRNKREQHGGSPLPHPVVDKAKGSQKIRVHQGDASFTVLYSDVLKHPNSFIAGYLRHAQLKGEVKVANIEVHDRDTYAFPYLAKFYKSDKLRLDNTEDKRRILMEFLFWFTTAEFDIEYEDPIAELSFLRVESMRKWIFDQETDITTKAFAAARKGYFFFHFDCDANQAVNEPEYLEVATTALEAIFPGNNIHINRADEFDFDICWSLQGTGELSTASRTKASEICEKLWCLIFENAKNANNRLGQYKANLEDIDSSLNDIFTEEYHFTMYAQYFQQYVANKTSYKLDLQLTPTFPRTFEIVLRWGLKEPSSKD